MLCSKLGFLYRIFKNWNILILKQTRIRTLPWVCHWMKEKTTTISISCQCQGAIFSLNSYQERKHQSHQMKICQRPSFSTKESSESEILQHRPKLLHFLSHVSPLTRGYSTCGIIDIWSWIILHCRGLSCAMYDVHCSTPHLSPLDASSTDPQSQPFCCDNQKCRQILPDVSCGAEWLRVIALNRKYT